MCLQVKLSQSLALRHSCHDFRFALLLKHTHTHKCVPTCVCECMFVIYNQLCFRRIALETFLKCCSTSTYIFCFGNQATRHGPNLEKQALNLIYFLFFSPHFVVVVLILLLSGTKCSSLILFYFILEPLQLALNVRGFLMRATRRKVSNFWAIWLYTLCNSRFSHRLGCLGFSNCHQLLASWEKHFFFYQVFLWSALMIIDIIIEFYQIDIDYYWPHPHVKQHENTKDVA